MKILSSRKTFRTALQGHLFLPFSTLRKKYANPTDEFNATMDTTASQDSDSNIPVTPKNTSKLALTPQALVFKCLTSRYLYFCHTRSLVNF